MDACDKKMLAKILGKLTTKLKGGQKGGATGTVKWFNPQKGYGFITPDDSDNDIFAHFSEIQGVGVKTLREGQKVTFEITQGPKGKQATKIQDTY